MRFRSGLFACLFLGATLVMSSPALADDADKLFEEGLAAYKQGKLEEAHSSYTAAWKLRRTQDLAAALAQVEMLLGKHRDAAEHLSYALRYFPVSGKKELRETLEKALAEAKAKVTEVHLRVTGDAQAPAITVDGTAIDLGVSSSDIFVAPGKRVIEVSAKGYQTVRQTIDAKEGQVIDVPLKLVPVEEPVGRSMVPPVIAFGAGGAGLVLGAITGAISIAKWNDFRAKCVIVEKTGVLSCPETVRGEVETGRTLGHVSTVGFVVAGVGAAAGVTLLLLPASSKAAPQASVVIGPAFLGVKGAF